MSASVTALPGPRWQLFVSKTYFYHMQALADRLRSMTDHERDEGIHGGSRGGQPLVQGGSTSRATLLSEPWILDLVKMGLAAAFAVGFTYAVMKDGLETGRRGFEGYLENKAAIVSERAAREASIASIKLAMEKEFHRMKTSFGKSLSDAIKPLVRAQVKTAEAVAVMAKGQESFEAEMRNALDRIRTSRSTP